MWPNVRERAGSNRGPLHGVERARHPSGLERSGRAPRPRAHAAPAPSAQEVQRATPVQTLSRLRGYLPRWLCDRDTWSVINATAWMLVALYLLLYSPM